VTTVLDVRELYVLFGGASSQYRSAQSARMLIVDPVTSASLVQPPGYHLGLANLTFTVDGGSCLAVLGRSGSGKSSLLRTLAGLQPAGGGRVLVNGRDVSALPAEQRSVVYLHQEPVLFPHLSVLENVAFPMTIRGVGKRDAFRRASEWLSRLHVAEVMGNAPDALSGGQRHRVALARALSAEPAALLLDEPLASLDPAVRRDVRAALLEVRAASGAAMILVTHDLDDAMAVASHISVIGPFGNLSAPMAPSQMLDQPPDIEAARLLGVFAELEGDVRDDARFHWIGGSVEAHGVQRGRAIACVRAHELRLLSYTVVGTTAVSDTAVGDTAIGDSAEQTHPLAVAELRESVHETSLVVRDDAGGLATIRVGTGAVVAVGDRVRVAVDRARFFSVD
jgi:putative spermidine/putrescine transport system ATP-binding protein